MGKERITSLEVARLAGVSRSAVSRAFTPGASVSPDTRDRVRAAATKLGYRPNTLARAMITGRSRIVGLVVAYLENYFYPDAVERLSARLQEEGYHVLVFLASQETDDVQDVMGEILDFQVEGIVLASVSMSSDLAARCDGHGIPVVLFNRDQDDERMCSVTTDNRAGGRAIAEHFLAAGHSRIGYIAGFEGASTQIDRERGFREGLAAGGAALHSHGIGGFRYDRARDATLAMFDRPDRPDALFVCNDHMAFAAMDALRSTLGLRVPEDVAVAGFDDVSIASWPAYDLTTFRQPIDRMVADTVATLLARIGDRSAPPRRVKLPGALILRGSSRNPIAGA